MLLSPSFLTRFGLGLACPLLLLISIGAAADTAESLIDRAGNTNDDLERQELLKQLAALPGIDPTLQKDAATLAEFARRWNESGLKFYGQEVRGQNKRILANYPFGIAQDSPLQTLADFYCGRMMAWTLIENSTIRTDPKESRWFRDEAQALFRKVAEAYPENEAARMYLGETQVWGKAHEPVPGAPEWAQLQREQLERLQEIIHWWIDHRQDESGAFGGGWGDDCEMWRWWSSVLMGFYDPKIVESQLRFSKAAAKRPHLKDGFNTQITDVEHAAEDTTDNLIPLMVLEPDNEKWTEWGLQMGDFMRDVWTGENAKGQRQFKSFYFSATETAPQPERAYDVIPDVGALHPALLAWQRTGDEELGELLCEWLDTWVDATARAENGKPAGILPASIRWPDGVVTGAEGKWWQPIKPGGYMHSYYIWPSVITEMTDALMLAHIMTGKESYLEPLRTMAAIRLAYLQDPPEGELEPGSLAWCGYELRPRPNANSNTGGVVKTLARFKALTGTKEFDELMKLEGAEFVTRDTPDGRAEMTEALRESLDALRVNYPGFTREVRSTDRVMRFVQFLAEDYEFDAYKGVTQPKHELLYRMVTGDKNAPRFPQLAVRWMTPPRDIAVLVTEANTSTLKAELYHFGEEPRDLAAELRQLAPGTYEVSLAKGSGLPQMLKPVTVTPGDFSKIPLILESGVLHTVSIVPSK